MKIYFAAIVIALVVLGEMVCYSQAQEMTIFVTPIPAVSKTFAVRVSASDTISQVKDKIEDDKGIHVGRQRLFSIQVPFHELEDDRTLASYNIQNGARFTLILF